jgi:hypothetical protein
MGRKPRAEHVGNQDKLGLFADRTIDTRRLANEPGGSNKFWVRVAHLMLRQPAASELIDQMLAGKAMIDNRGTTATQVRGAEPVLRTLTGHEARRLATQEAFRCGGPPSGSFRPGAADRHVVLPNPTDVST